MEPFQVVSSGGARMGVQVRGTMAGYLHAERGGHRRDTQDLAQPVEVVGGDGFLEPAHIHSVAAFMTRIACLRP